MYMTGDPDGSPTKIGTALGDWVGGLTAFGMIGTAMYYRSITGKGQHIDISLARLLMWMSARFDFTYTGKQDFRSGNHHTTLAPYGIFNGNNGESIIIGALNQNLWTKLCNVMGKPELADDPKFVTNDKRCENLPEVVAHIESWLKTFDHMADAEKLLMDAGVPCAKTTPTKTSTMTPISTPAARSPRSLPPTVSPPSPAASSPPTPLNSPSSSPTTGKRPTWARITTRSWKTWATLRKK